MRDEVARRMTKRVQARCGGTQLYEDVATVGRQNDSSILPTDYLGSDCGAL